MSIPTLRFGPAYALIVTGYDDLGSRTGIRKI